MNIGVDIGGSHIGVGLVGSSGKILYKNEKEFTDEDRKDIENVINKTIIKSIYEVLAKGKLDISEIGYIGIASPGLVEGESICNLVNLGISKLNVVKAVKAEFNAKIRVKNDAKCAAIAESIYGSTKPVQDSIYLCLGTGIGGAAILNNKLIEPKVKSGMEFGHMIIEKDGRLCKCGSRGCFETYCSMRALKKDISDVLDLDKNLSGKEIIQAMRDNFKTDKVQNVVGAYVEYLAIGISNLINIFEPETICLGGSYAYIDDLITPMLKRTISNKNLLFNSRKSLNILPATLGNNAGIIGVASLL